MRLLIDIGNTRTKYVFESEGQLSAIHAEDNQALTEPWFNQVCQGIKEVVVANVNQPTLTQSLASWAKKENIMFLSVDSEKSAFGVTTAYDNPSQLGVDRWLALIGAKILYPNKNVLVIDAGTATTIDLLHNNGQHQGGWILPGVDTMFNSLLKETVHVSAQKTEQPSLSFGKNTSECVNHACWAATIACITQGITEAEKYSIIDIKLLIGGNGIAINELLTEKLQLNEKLIFIGLQAYCTK